MSPGFKWALLISIIAILVCVYINNKKSNRNIRIKFSDEMISLNNTFQRLCPSYNVWSNKPVTSNRLGCFCKVDLIWHKGCWGKVEILNENPVVAIVHKYFTNNDILQFQSSVFSSRMRKAVYTNEFGFSWNSKELKHFQGYIHDNDASNQKFFNDVSKLIGSVLPCNGYPTINIAKYSTGDYLKIHHEGYGAHSSNTFNETVINVIRKFVTVFEDCRNLYVDLNMFQCLYLRYAGKIHSSIYWSNSVYGAPVASSMVQLSDVVGGETIFPNLNLSVHTNRGDLLYFENTNEMGKNLDETFHGACPTLSKEKIVMVGRIPGLCNNLSDLRKNFYRRA